MIAKRKQQRRYNGLVIVVRAIIFALLMAVSWQAAAVYVIAYLLMITVLRFQDSLQHDYDYELTLFSTQKAGQYKGDKAYETEHTFSVPISTRWPILNVLVLNFGYHNAHHARPTLPWYKLPTYHREHFDDDCCIPFKKQLAIFHRYRVARILGEGGELDDQIAVGEQFLKQAKQGKVYGGNAASFLTPF